MTLSGETIRTSIDVYGCTVASSHEAGADGVSPAEPDPTMINLGKLLTPRYEQDRYYECRHCGCPATRRTARCPDCGNPGIASYRF